MEAREQAQADISASMAKHQQLAQDSERLALSVQAQAASLHTLQQQQQEQDVNRWSPSEEVTPLQLLCITISHLVIDYCLLRHCIDTPRLPNGVSLICLMHAESDCRTAWQSWRAD